VVLAKPKKKQGKKGKESKLDWFVKIADVSVTDLADNETSNISNGFELKNKKKPDETVILCCENLETKRAWVKDIKTHFKDHQKMEAARRKYSMTTKQVSTTPTRTRIKSQLPAKGKPDPPPDDGDEEWESKQEQEQHELEPPGFIMPTSRWNNWLEYQDDVFQISYYYHLDTKETIWQKPCGWTVF